MYIMKLEHSGWDDDCWDFDIGVTNNRDVEIMEKFNNYSDNGNSAKCVEILEGYRAFQKGPAKRRFEHIIDEIQMRFAEEIADYKICFSEICSLD